MNKAPITKISIGLLLLLLNGWQIVFAQDNGVPGQPPQSLQSPSQPPPAPLNAPSNPLFASATPTSTFESDFAFLQSWLKRNQPRRMVKCKDAPVVVSQATSAPVVIPAKPLTYEKSQKMMLKLVPSEGAPDPDSEAAFSGMMQQNMPLSPQQVVRLRQMIDQSQRAASIPATVPPKPVSSTIMVNLAPGATPPAIRLSQGYVTSLVFVDSTGSPWPIASYDIGDPKTVNPQWDGKSNVLLIQASSPYGDSDLVIRLVGLATPITFELVLGQRVVDYRTDIHVSGIGPNTKDLPTGTALPNSANQLLLGVLDGVPPPGSKQLTVTGGDCLAWLLGDRMYLRTRLTVLSPGWVGRMVSPDGMFAYEIQKSSSVLVSQYGEPIELKLEGF